jgi:uncharacterized sporulation protein YeaH/YhbH (DUF444 family)
MALRIETDHSRFKAIVRGKIKQNLEEVHPEGRDDRQAGQGDVVSIPVPSIELPRFKFGHRDTGGTGQGEGEGRRRAPAGARWSPAKGRAPATRRREHALEVDVTMEELAQMLGEELKPARGSSPRAKSGSKT